MCLSVSIFAQVRSSRNVIFLADDIKQTSFSIDFPFIILHAICKDVKLFSKPCVYCSLDVGADDSDTDSTDSDSNEELEENTSHANAKTKQSPITLASAKSIFFVAPKQTDCECCIALHVFCGRLFAVNSFHDIAII